MSTAAHSPSPAVEVTGLTKSFGSLTAVDRLDLKVARGEVVAFLGPNGAGKSTTLDVILGFTRPDAGTVRVLGVPPAQAVLQSGGLIGSYTVRQTLAVVASLQCRTPDVEAVIAQAGIGPLLSRKVSACSGGERQRLRLALALLPRPALLVLDEPTAGMDPTGRAAFWRTMRAQTAEGRSILFATHYLQEASDVADRIVIIDRGRPVASGSVDEIRSLAEGTTVTATWAGLTGEAELHRVLSPVAGSLLEVEVHGSHVTVRTTAPDDVARLLLTATPATRLGITALSLEEVFSRLVGTHRAENPAASRTA